MPNQFHHEDLKTELIEEAIKLLSSKGTDRFSLRNLARRCNVSEAAPYSHFKNKDELFEAITDHITDGLYNSLLKARDGATDPDSPAAVYEVGKAYVTFFIDNPYYFDFIFSQPCIRIDLSMQGTDDYRPFTLFRDMCFDIYRKEGMDDESIKYGIISMWAKVHGIAAITRMQNVTTDFDMEKELERILPE